VTFLQSKSSPLAVTQQHIPAEPGQVQVTNSEDEPQVAIHNVNRPVRQEVNEVIQPYRSLTQTVEPVIESTHTNIARGEGYRLTGLTSGVVGGTGVLGASGVGIAGYGVGSGLGYGYGSGYGSGLGLYGRSIYGGLGGYGSYYGGLGGYGSLGGIRSYGVGSGLGGYYGGLGGIRSYGYGVGSGLGGYYGGLGGYKSYGGYGLGSGIGLSGLSGLSTYGTTARIARF